jgi:hypothetical protein
MKRQQVLILGGAVLLILGSASVPGVLAVARPTASPLISSARTIEPPLNRRCVVTVDPLQAPKPVIAGSANIVTGFVAPDTAEGVLIMLDADWLVLRDGCNENWIPKNKVIMIHVCD